MNTDNTTFTWNHRVVRGKDGLLSFAEVHYENGKPVGYSDCFMCGETTETLQTLLAQLTRATQQPIIDEADMNGESA